MKKHTPTKNTTVTPTKKKTMPTNKKMAKRHNQTEDDDTIVYDLYTEEGRLAWTAAGCPGIDRISDGHLSDLFAGRYDAEKVLS